jgi:transcription elongation factor Elf1
MPTSDIKVDVDDKEAFAKAAFEAAVKVAATNGVKVTRNVSVEIEGDQTLVSVAGTRMTDEEKAEAKKTTAADLKARKEARQKMISTAQFGGEGGGMAAAPGGDPMGGGGTTMPTAPAGAPMAPGAPPVGALAGGPEDEGLGEEDETAEALPPGSICPVCGTDDVELSNGEGQCDSCGAKFNISVNYEVTRYPDTVIETEPGEDSGEEEDLGEAPGIGEMEGGPGMEMPEMEMPEMGVAASFKLTQQMVKVAKNAPIGSFCPSCGSKDVKLAVRKGTSRGECLSCGGQHKVDTFVDSEDGKTIWARVEWKDRAVTKLAMSMRKESVSNRKKASKLAKALAFKSLTVAFEKGDLKKKASIIHDLKAKGLLD